MEATVRHANSHIAHEIHTFGLELSLTHEQQRISHYYLPHRLVIDVYSWRRFSKIYYEPTCKQETDKKLFNSNYTWTLIKSKLPSSMYNYYMCMNIRPDHYSGRSHYVKDYVGQLWWPCAHEGLIFMVKGLQTQVSSSTCILD